MPKPQRSSPIYGTDNPETIHGTSGNDIIYGYAGNDIIYGYGGNDTLYGHEGIDSLYGGDGDDTMSGQEDDDFLFGEGGNDRLWFSGFGLDTLTGGSGADTFYSGSWTATDQQVGEVLITDFETGVDTLDLSRFDADETTAVGGRGNRTTGNEAFTVVGADETDGVTPGHLVITTGTDANGQPITLVLGYTNTQAGADIVIQLSGVAPGGLPLIAASDILL